ncbi:MAG: M20/M25/M40 family metallo-hydrolase [Gemmatimonadales bacterium]
MSRSPTLAASLLAASYLALAGCASGQPLPELDSARLLSDLSVLAHDSMEGRAAGTAGGQRARAFLSRALGEAGARPFAGGFEQPFAWTRGSGVNLVGMVPGRSDPGSASGDVIFLTAHYDHLGVRDGQIFNGADDNASGAAAVLEIVRRVSREPLEHTLLVALFDAEELGSRGARALVAEPPVPLERVALDVNLDMVARTAGLLWAGGAAHTPALRPVLEGVAARAPVTLRLGHDRPGAPEGDDWTEQSDHVAFHEVGIPFVYFGVEDHPDYHRPTDDVERIDPGEYVAAVRTILMALRALDAALPLEPR